jgi:hypothetical protein
MTKRRVGLFVLLFGCALMLLAGLASLAGMSAAVPAVAGIVVAILGLFVVF